MWLRKRRESWRVLCVLCLAAGLAGVASLPSLTGLPGLAGLARLITCTAYAAEAGQGTARVAWGARTPESGARSIVLFSAWHRALSQAADTVDSLRLARAACETRAEKMALALSIFPAEEMLWEYRSDAPTDRGEMEAAVTFRSDVDTMSNAVRSVLEDPELLRLRAELLEYAAPLLHEALELLARARALRQSGRRDADAPYGDRISYLAGQLDAVRMVEAACHRAGSRRAPHENVQLLEAALRRDPENIYGRVLLAEHYLVLNRPQKALEMFDACIRSAPEYARAYYGRGLTHVRLHQEALAIDAFTKALNLRPDVPEWLQARGIAHMLRQENEAMCTDFYAACALGLCTGLEMVSKKGQCLKTHDTNE